MTARYIHIGHHLNSLHHQNHSHYSCPPFIQIHAHPIIAYIAYKHRTIHYVSLHCGNNLQLQLQVILKHWCCRKMNSVLCAMGLFFSV